MRLGKAQSLRSTSKTACQGEDFGQEVLAGSVLPVRRFQVAVSSGVPSGTDYPFEDLHQLASEPETSGFSHDSQRKIQKRRKGTLSKKFF